MAQGIIFDLDGVLLDYSYRFHKTYEDVLGRYGFSCPARDVIMNMRRQCSNSQLEVLDRFLIPKDAPDRKEIIENCAREREAKIENPEYVALDQFFEPAIKVVDDLRNHRGYKTALITRRKNQDLFLEQIRPYQSLFDFIETSFQKEPAIKKFINQSKTQSAIFLTDTANDVKAGRAAGVQVAGVLTGLESEERLRCAGADHILQDVSGIYSLPGFK